MSTYVLGAGIFATQFATRSPSVPTPIRISPAAVTAAAAAAVKPATPVAPIAIKVKSPLLQRAIDREIAARAAQASVRSGVPVSLKSPLLTAAVQKAIAARSMQPRVAPVPPSVLEQTGLNPPVTAAPTINPTSPYSFVPDASGGGGGSAPSPAVTATPDVQEASLFPTGDATDQMSQVDTAAAAGDLSEQEVASIKADMASKPAQLPSTGWIPVALLIGLVAVSVIQSRRTGGRIGRRGWGN